MDAEAVCEQGVQAYGAGDLFNARSLFEQAAHAGSTRAMMNLGVLGLQDDDTAQAERWFTAACDAGEPEGYYGLGQTYEVLGHDARAISAYRSGSITGSDECMNSLALWLLDNGADEEGQDWLWRAVQRGNEAAQTNWAARFGDQVGPDDLPFDPATIDAKLEPLLDQLVQSGGSDAGCIDSLVTILRDLRLDPHSPDRWGLDDVAAYLSRRSRDCQDPVCSVVLHSLILLLPWPVYDRGDGYWPAPSRAATALVQIGQLLPPRDIVTARRLPLALDEGIAFTELGVCTNTRADSNTLFSIATRPSAETGVERPPLAAISCAHPNFPVDHIRDVVNELLNEDSVPWLQRLIAREDGWMWPDWQSAYGEATSVADRSEAFWVAVLTPAEGKGRCTLAEFDEDLDLDVDFYAGSLDDLQALTQSSPVVAAAARSSGWPPVQELVA